MAYTEVAEGLKEERFIPGLPCGRPSQDQKDLLFRQTSDTGFRIFLIGDVTGRIEKIDLSFHPKGTAPYLDGNEGSVLSAVNGFEGCDLSFREGGIDPHDLGELGGRPAGIPDGHMPTFQLLPRISQGTCEGIAKIDENAVSVQNMDSVHRRFQKKFGPGPKPVLDRYERNIIWRSFGGHGMLSPRGNLMSFSCDRFSFADRQKSDSHGRPFLPREDP